MNIVSTLGNWAKNKVSKIGISLGFECFKKYSEISILIENFLYDNYYKKGMIQVYMDFVFEWYHYFTTTIFCKSIEPLYNPWVSIFYMKSGKEMETYCHLKKNSEITEFFPRNSTAALPLEIGTPLLDKTEETMRIFEALNSIYYTYNFVKSVQFDTCYDYLIVLKYKNTYISRVGVYNGMKDLRKEDFSIEKTVRSILMVEYTHHKMAAPILLNIDSGYFIENNEILSPMFIYRALKYQNSPYVFDYTYKLKFMDSNIKSHTIDSNSFILLKKNGYEVISMT